MGIYGIPLKSNTLKNNSDLQFFYDNGFVVLRNIVTPNDLKQIKELILHFLPLQEEASLKSSQANEKNILRCPLFYHSDFLRLVAMNSKVIELVESLIGKNIQLHLQNAIINKAFEQHHQANWHKDIPYQFFYPNGFCSISAMTCIDDFNEVTGGTVLSPKSLIPVLSPEIEELEKSKFIPEAKAGDVIIFDSFLWHRSGQNKSNADRLGVNTVYTTPIFRQQIDLPEYLAFNKEHYSNDELKILGFDWTTPKSVIDFRKER